MHTNIKELKVGDRVKLVEVVDNYPTVFVEAGETGTVSEITDEIVWVRMDRTFPEIAEWDNCLEIWREWRAQSLERIG